MISLTGLLILAIAVFVILAIFDRVRSPSAFSRLEVFLMVIIGLMLFGVIGPAGCYDHLNIIR